jgi:hypothetical protein
MGLIMLRSRWLILAVLATPLCLDPDVRAQGSGPEKAAKRLDDLLQPGSKITPPAGAPSKFPGNKTVEKPEPLPRVYEGTPPKPPLASAGKIYGPRSVPEGSPPVAFGVLPVLPQEVELPTQALVVLPAVDVESPLPLPLLARPKPDRASLEDTTLEASQAAALRPFVPRRTTPVPFAPLNLPDPFENQRHGGLRRMLDENDQPPATPVRTPR